MKQTGMTTRGARSTPVLSTIGVAAMMAAFGCGLISSDVAKISFDLPARSYSFDTQQTGWNTATTSKFSMTVPSVGCGADADCCSQAVTLAGLDCSSIICDPVSSTCAFTVTVETPPQEVNLRAQAPELSGLSGQSLADVTVSQITYDVTTNTMNVDLPSVDLFVAPKDVTSTSDPSASLFATVPVIPKGTTTDPPLRSHKVKLDAAGQQALIGFAHDFATPFVFLSRTRVVVPGGTPVPSGALSLTINGRLSAKPSL
jgi:hypothetical protein